MTSNRDLIDTEGRVTRWPKKAAEREHVLSYLGGKFYNDRTYTENEVNDILRAWHTYGDWSSLRRDLIGYGYATRDRSGLEYQFKKQEDA